MTSFLTIIITFLNEGAEVKNTLMSIKETTTSWPSVILINDASTDQYDYRAVSDEFGCEYIEHAQRKGVAASRDEGVTYAKTDYFLFLDAHMRFYETGWDARLIKLLKENPRSILCGQTQKLTSKENGKVVAENHKTCYGACISMNDLKVFKAAWNYKDTMPDSNLLEIPCILGAAYACEKKYWEWLGGLNGLRSYGFDEELISLKVWLEGGRCLLIKDWITGHIYRRKMPYTTMTCDLLYNQLYVLELFFPYEFKLSRMKLLQSNYGLLFDEAFESIKSNYKQVKKQKELIKSMTTTTIEQFLLRNDQVEVCAI